MTLASVLSVLCLSGCLDGGGQVAPDGGSSGADVESVKNARFGRVPVELVSPRLETRVYEDMLVELVDVVYPDVTAIVSQEVNGKVASAGESHREDILEVEKTIVRGRWLLKGAESGSYDNYQQVVDEAIGGLKLDPNDGRLYELLAQGHLAMDNKHDGQQAAYKAVLLRPDRYQGWQSLGEIALSERKSLLAAGYLKKALASQDAIDIKPINLVLQMQMAGALSEAGFWTAACKQYRSAWKLLMVQRRSGQANRTVAQLAARPHVPLLLMAQLNLQMGKIDTCVELLDEVRTILGGKNDVEVHRQFVISLLQQSLRLKTRYNQVTAICRYMISVSKAPEESLRIFYYAISKMAKYKAYIVELEQWHSADGGAILDDRLYALGLALGDQNDKAEVVLTALSGQSNDEPLVYRDLGELYAKTGQWPKMLVAYSRYMQLDKSHMQDGLRVLDGHLDSVDDLAKYFKLWQVDPGLKESSVGNYLLGRLADKLHKTRLCEDYYREALKIDPQFSYARSGLIEILLNRGDYKEVLGWIEKEEATKDEIITPEMLRYAGRACSGLGQYGRAADYYRKLIERDKHHNGAYIDLASVTQRQGNFEHAESILLRVVANRPDSLDVYHRLVMLYTQWEATAGVEDLIRGNAIKRGRKMTRLFLETIAQLPGSVAHLKRESLLGDVMKVSKEHPKAQVASMVICELYAANGMLKKAVSEIERLLLLFPDDGRVLLRAAELNEKLGNDKASARHRLRLCQMSPDDPVKLRIALAALRYADRPQEALELMQKRLEDESFRRKLNVIDTLEAEAVRLFLINRKYPQAVDLFQEWYERVQNPAVGEKAVSRELLVTIGNDLIWALTDAGQYDKAVQETIKMFSPEHEVSPHAVVLASWLSRTLNIRMRFETSLSLLDNILAIKPDLAAVRLQMYMTLIDQGRTDEAIEQSRQWHLASPDDRKRRNSHLLVLQTIGDFQAAAQQQREFIKTDPQNEAMRIQLANILINSGRDEDFREAEVLLDELKKNRKLLSQWFDIRVTLDLAKGNWQRAMERIDELPLPKDSPHRPHLKVQILSLAGQIDKAIAEQKAIVDSDPNDIGPQLQYSVLLDRIGRTDESIDQLESVLREYPDNPVIKNNLAYTLTENHKNIDRAYQLLRESLLDDPKSTPTLDSLGWFYYKKGDFLAALVYIYQSASSMAMPDAEILNHLGDIVYRLGRKEDARIFWQRALDDLARRVRSETWLKNELEHTKKKLQQLNDNQPVEVAPIFNEGN